MATYRTMYAGNTALQTEIWTMPLAEAKATMPLLDTRKGTYWETTILKPYRRAVRAKADTVKIYTAHFSTSELSNALYNAQVSVTKTQEN